MKNSNKSINVGGDTFEVVKKIPTGYRVWNATGKEGYFLIEKPTGTNKVDINTVKAIKSDGFKYINSMASRGVKTQSAVETYIKKYEGRTKTNITKRQVEIAKRALEAYKKL